MQHFLSPENTDIIIKLFVAMICGMVIGMERLFAHKTATMRTYSLVALGAALFIIVSEKVALGYSGFSGFNPTQMAASIITGVGFLGAGLMIWRGTKLIGITSATGLWVAAGIGMGAGFGFFSISVIATILSLFIFVVLWFVEARLREVPFIKESDNGNGDENE